MKRPGLLLALVIVVATVLRVYHLGSLPVEQDELYTLRDARDFSLSVKPLYYYLQHLLLGIFPAETLYLRLLPFAFGVLGVVATWELGRRLFGLTAAAVAGSLAAVSAWLVYESQLARYWTLIYLLFALFIVLLLEAHRRDRGGLYLAALATSFLGILTHPTFAFPVLGVCVALVLVADHGRIRWRAPTAPARWFFWLPLLLVVVGGLAWLAATGNLGALRNRSGRGLAASLRLLPGVAQWISAAVAGAAVIGIAYLARSGTSRDRWWAGIVVLGTLSTLGLMVLASFVTDVYVDYATPTLVLAYVSIGGVSQRLTEAMPRQAPGLAIGCTLIIASGILPGVVSHASDGTRFDYEATYELLDQVGRDQLIVGWPRVIQELYAPGLRFEEIPPDTMSLNTWRRVLGELWFVLSRRRYSAVGVSPAVQSWLDSNCRRTMTTQRPRLDYRSYRVELWRCPVPAGPDR